MNRQLNMEDGCASVAKLAAHPALPIPDFELTGAQMRSGDYDPAAIRTLWTWEHRNAFAAMYVEAGIAIPHDSANVTARQSTTGTISESA